MKIEQWNVGDVIPYANNPRKNDDAVEYVANSIKEFGFQQPIVVDSNGVVIVGHTRLKAARKLGLETVPVVVADGLNENQVEAYRLADNKVAEFSLWDFDKLNEELEAIDWQQIDMTNFGFYLDKEIEENPYNSEVNGLIYEPTGEDVSIFDLCDTAKANELQEAINASDLPAEEKEFLTLAAMRHVVFDYGKIANYYANATPEMQGLMEQSALVIVDFDKAIENGYVKMRTAFDEELGDVI